MGEFPKIVLVTGVKYHNLVGALFLEEYILNSYTKITFAVKFDPLASEY